jgi:hypothetical protein
MENGRRLPQAQRARLSESFTIVLLALLQPSADTGFELAIDWRCSSRTNMIISSWYMRVLLQEARRIFRQNIAD